MRHGLTALTVAASLSVVLLAGCAAATPAPGVSPSRGASAGEAPASSAPAAPSRPETGVEPWTDYGDFAVDSNKAIGPVHNLQMEERWEDFDYGWRIAGTAQARWAGSWEDNTRVEGLAREVFQKAAADGRVGLVAYQGMRDYPCERAAGDPSLEQAYMARTEALVRTLPETGAEAWIMLEPALLPTLDTCEGDPRPGWLAQGVDIVFEAGGVIYLDASGFADLEPADAAARVSRLADAGVDFERVAGFSLNIGRYRPTGEARDWGAAFLAALEAQGVSSTVRGIDPGQPGRGVVVDTSRNGVPLEGESCNSPEAGIGTPPRRVGEGVLDAVVWIKRPGESDGPCNGGLAIGQFQLGKALELARNGVHDDPALPARDA